MEVARDTFWNIPHWSEYTQYGLGGLTMLVFAVGIYLRVRKWRQGGPEAGMQSIPQIASALVDRTIALVRDGLFQWRLSSDPFSVKVTRSSGESARS